MKLETGGIPVPKYYWMIIYDKKEHEGVAFLGLNDPYSKDLKPTDLPCSNMCHQLKWLDDEKKAWFEDEKKGHIACYKIECFATVVENVANFQSQGGRDIKDAVLLRKIKS